MSIPLATLPTQPGPCRFTLAVQVPALDLPGFIDRGDRQAPPPPGLAGGLIQPSYGEPAHHPDRLEGILRRAAKQPLGLARDAGAGESLNSFCGAQIISFYVPRAV